MIYLELAEMPERCSKCPLVRITPHHDLTREGEVKFIYKCMVTGTFRFTDLSERFSNCPLKETSE